MSRYAPAIAFHASHPVWLARQIAMTCNDKTVNLPFVFVTGPPRSGTTLVHRLLMNHSLLAGFEDETAIFSFQPIAEYRRFRRICSREAYEQVLRGSASLAEFCIRLHSKCVSLPHGGRYVEKSAQHATWMKYIAKRIPLAQFIFCIRDPRDAYCSGRVGGLITQANSINAHAQYFLKCLRDVGAPDFPARDRTYVIRYEDLAVDPRGQLDHMSRFLNIPFETAGQLAALASAADQRATKPEFLRLSSPITPATVGRWRREMTQANAKRYQQAAAAAMARFGYDLE